MITVEVTLPCRRTFDDQFSGLFLWERCMHSNILLASIWFGAQIGTASGAGITPWERAAAWPVCVFSWVWTVPAIHTIKWRHFADLTFHLIYKGIITVQSNSARFIGSRFIKKKKKIIKEAHVRVKLLELCTVLRLISLVLLNSINLKKSIIHLQLISNSPDLLF